MSDANKAVTRRIYEEVFNQGRLETIDEIITPDAVDHSPPPNSTGDTPGDLKAFTAAMREAFPDVRFTVVDEIAEGDKVVVHYEMTGTQEADFLGIPPSGKPVTMRGVDIITVVDGKCTEHWGWDDSWKLFAGEGGPPG